MTIPSINRQKHINFAIRVDIIKIKMKITLVKVIHILHDTHIWYMITLRKYLTRTSMHTGSVVVVIAWKLDLQLPVQSVLITTEVVMSNPAHGEVHSI